MARFYAILARFCSKLSDEPIRMTIDLNRIQQALAEHRYETARRFCLDLLSRQPGEKPVLRALHLAYRALGDFQNACAVLAGIEPDSAAERLELLLLQGEDFHRLSSYEFYRNSEESRAGFTGDEYEARMTRQADERFEAAAGLASTASEATALATVLKRCKRKDWAARVLSPYAAAPQKPVQPAPPSRRTASLAGMLRFPDGAPIANATVKLALSARVEIAPPVDVFNPSSYPTPIIENPSMLGVRTDATGRFHFEHIPPGRHEFLAVILDPEAFDVCTHFLAHGIEVQEDDTALREFTVSDWVSASSREIPDPFPAEMERAGLTYRLRHREVWKNPFYFDFPRQAVEMQVPGIEGRAAGCFLLLDSQAPGEPLVFQKSGSGLLFMTDLPVLSDRVVAVYEAVETPVSMHPEAMELVPDEDGATAVIDTGRALFRLPWNGENTLPPLIAVQGEDGLWRGQGRFVGGIEHRIVARETRVLEQGPVQLRVEVRYELEDGYTWSFVFTAHRDEPYLLVHETAPELDGAFEFSLRDFCDSPRGGRSFLHWKPEYGDAHWHSLTSADHELARLQEQTPWWIAPQGFACALTPDGTENQDYVAVFSRRRGEWIDRRFEEIANGPVDLEGQENRELDWPYPEMMGSTISMISARTDTLGDAYFRFPAFDGERHWGVLVSTLERNDGPYKELSVVQHKTSSPRLQDFKDWHLDEPDSHARPMVVARRGELRHLRSKRNSPVFASIWTEMTGASRPGAGVGLRFAVEGDPLIAWRKKQQLLAEAHLRSRMTLLGRDYSDMYSPVGARPITHWAEEYDLIAASGVFTPDEERLVRAFLMLMGHMYMERDFMNWNFNSRNANFEADRVDVVGAIGLCFHGNPDAERFVRHAAGRLEQSLRVYCTPGSGKWYENPACYYLHASKCYMNLMFHMARHGVCDPVRIPRLKEFLRWGILLLTPPTPPAYEAMRDGLSEAEYASTAKVRRIAPIGDHAYLGPWVPEHYAFMSQLFRAEDPEFADLLLWAYQAGGASGGYFGNLPLLFAAMETTDLELSPAFDPEPVLRSRRLEGFGATMRGAFGQENEFYLLLKQGPGGYRYHRSEGSFLLFANGKPLVYDGGEAGETWRHSTLSFHAAHTPLSPGRVERFHSAPELDFVQGIHPVLLNPGDPIFLSDNCRHELVEEAYARHAVTAPAVSRALFWIKDEYVIVHDELRIPADVESHWHLQVVAQGESGDARDGFRFQGRFGTDLQVVFPGQEFTAASVERLPILDYFHDAEHSFAMRHLQLTASAPDHYLAVLRPVFGAQLEVNCSALHQDGRTVGVRVHNETLEDRIFCHRDSMVFHEAGIHFEGRYGAILQRLGRTMYILLDGTYIEAYGVGMRSNGAPVHLEVTESSVRLFSNSASEVEITGLQRPIDWQFIEVPAGTDRAGAVL